MQNAPCHADSAPPLLDFIGYCDEYHSVCRTLLHAQFDQQLAYFWRSQQWIEEDLTTKDGLEEAMYRTAMIIETPCLHAPFAQFAYEMNKRIDHGLQIRQPGNEMFDALKSVWLTVCKH